MESSATLRSFHYFAGGSRLQLIEKPSKMYVSNTNKSSIQGPSIFGKPIHTLTNLKRTVVSCTKTPEVTETAKPKDSVQGSVQKKPAANATFPNGFEALVLEVCDETEIAELKLKVGEFEMHLKRNIGVVRAPLSAISPTVPPPIPSKPMVESAPTLPAPPKPSSEKTTPFTNVPLEKSSKLAALEASGSKGYVLVSSPTVGSFRRGRTVKGKKQPPICKENDVIKEGQVIGYVDQFGTELPVKSDVAGEVLKVLFKEGEAVGYGDPLVAVLPAFHGIR
ncbi:biotin carboxyl carrier protein of acetyl-CoA carboxylase [Benincasa hispida]|uniref:biotin carboxyl carrier protein of acetyl-CoA carboxylase n=1 Tax=Benincasa hispida TaxID=102211 RepID=UPI001902ADE8|nr:biotin carboxyl carrier protein of acetyl-CoA carboxylase [Benincasa hispida]